MIVAASEKHRDTVHRVTGTKRVTTDFTLNTKAHFIPVPLYETTKLEIQELKSISLVFQSSKL